MMKPWFVRLGIGLACLASLVASAEARITHIEITKSVYLAAFKKAADDLVAKRFLLPDDADALVKSAESGVRNAP
jgi:hypothetical protein